MAATQKHQPQAPPQTFPVTTEAPIRDVTTRAEQERANREVQAMIYLAQEHRRIEEKAMREIERVAKIPEFATKAYYSYPRSQREIFGPSICLADEMKRIWGNIVTKMTIPYEDEEGFVIEVIAWDLETNASSSRQAVIKNLIFRKDAAGRGQWIKPDERDKRELIERQHSLLRRNCILSLVPRWFVDKIVMACRNTIKKQVGKGNIDELRQKIQQDFEAMGIYREQIEGYLQHSFSASNVEEITELQGILQSIRDGVAKREDYFSMGRNPKTAPEGMGKTAGGMSLDDVLSGEVKNEGMKEGPRPPEAKAGEPAPQDQIHGEEVNPPPKRTVEDGYADERLLEEWKKTIAQASTDKDVNDAIKDLKKNKAGWRISDDLFGKMMTVANDRLREISQQRKKR